MGNRRVCVVTGGSGGIGLAVARQFATARYDLAVCGRNQDRLTSAVGVLGEQFAVDVFGLTTDLSSAGSGRDFIEETRARFGRIDVLVNNAGLAPKAAIDEFEDSDVAAALAVNNAALVETTRSAWPLLAAGGGTVVSLSSLAAVDPFPGFSVYGATKAFVEAFTQAIANEGRAVGVRAYCVRPGAVETPLLRSLFPDFPADDCLTPDDVAALILNVCSDSMQYSSGQTITIKK